MRIPTGKTDALTPRRRRCDGAFAVVPCPSAFTRNIAHEHRSTEAVRARRRHLAARHGVLECTFAACGRAGRRSCRAHPRRLPDSKGEPVMTISHARVRTDHASDYLVRLSKDWIRDIPALAFNDRHAVIPFPGARCELVAGEGFLDITLTTNSETKAVMFEHLLAGHIDSLSRGENLKYQWELQ